jgi:hypothetical protein
LQAYGCYPLEPGGLKLWCRLKTIQQVLGIGNEIHPNLELEKLLGKLSIVGALRPQYR